MNTENSENSLAIIESPSPTDIVASDTFITDTPITDPANELVNAPETSILSTDVNQPKNESTELSTELQSILTELEPEFNIADEVKTDEIKTDLILYGDLTLPEGMQIADTERFNQQVSKLDGTISNIVKNFNIPEDKAIEFRNELATLGLNAIQENMAKINSQVSELMDKVKRTTIQEIENKKIELSKLYTKQLQESDLGGDKLQETANLAIRTLNELSGTKEVKDNFIKTLTQAGIGNHPDVFKFLINASNKIKEGEMVASQTSAIKKDRYKTMYG
jgi:hypothetical protein